MIRPFTIICLMLAAISGLYLYQTKHRTLVLDRRIGAVLKQAEEARAATVLLRAQYAQLSRPDRLMALSQHLLTLRPTTPDQFVQLAALDSHLPPIEIFPKPGALPLPGPPIANPDQAIAAAAAAALPGGVPAGPAVAPLSAPEPVRMAAAGAPAAPPRSIPHGIVVAHAAPPVPRPSMVDAASRQPPSPAPRAQANYAAYHPAYRAPMPVIQGSLPATRMRQMDSAPARSMLGGSSSLDLAPPIPAAN